MITIRKAKLTDLDRMMEIYARAKRFMDSTGNTTQWEIGYPTRKMIQDDIENGYSFVCMGEDNIPHAAFKFFVGEDPTYRAIEQGSWKMTIHTEQFIVLQVTAQSREYFHRWFPFAK